MNPQRSFLSIFLFFVISHSPCLAPAADNPAPFTQNTASKIQPLNNTSDKLQATTKAQKKVTLPGYCCKEGKSFLSSKMECQKLHGTYFITEREATLKCTGFCCEDGTVSKTTEKICRDRRGLFFGKERAGEDRCAKDRGFCCKESTVSPSTEKNCKKSRGLFYHSKRTAFEQCPGYCCIDGKTKLLSKRECQAKRGILYSSKTVATARCTETKGYCNDNEKTLQITQKACDKRKGKFFKTEMLARADLRNTKMQAAGRKKIKAAPVPHTATLTTERKPLPRAQIVPAPSSPIPPSPQSSPPQLRNLPPQSSDLYLSQNSWSSNPKFRDTLGHLAILNMTVRNTGTLPSSETTMEIVPESAPGGVSPSDTNSLQMSIQIPSLIPGQTFSFSWPQASEEKWRKGNYKIHTSIQVDPAGESNEMNNVHYITFSPQSNLALSGATIATQLSEQPIAQTLSVSKPDLTVTLEPPAEILYQLGTYIFRGTVNNIGTEPSPATKLSLLLVGKGYVPLAPSMNIDSLQPGWSVSVWFQGTIGTTSYGEKTVTLIVDTMNLIDEANEENNMAQHPVSCLPPDKTSEMGLFKSGSPEEYGVTHPGHRTEPIDIPIKVYNFLDNTTSPQTKLTISCDPPQEDQTTVVESISAGNNLINYREYHFIQNWYTIGIKHCQATLSTAPGYTDANYSNNQMDFKVQITDPIEPWQAGQ